MSGHSVLLEFLTAPNLIVGVLLYGLITYVISIVRAPRYPTSIPWAGHGKGWLAQVKNAFDAFTHSNEWVRHGYERYSKNETSYVLPNSFGTFKEIIVPRSQMQWMLDQPDSVLSTSEAHYDTLHGDFSFIEKNVLKDPYHEHIIHKNLARNLTALFQYLDEEVVFNIDNAFGTDTENWKKMNIMETFFRMVPKITNRMLVGSSLCRNQEYIYCCVGFTKDVIRNMLLFALTPKSSRPILGPLASLPAKYHFWKTSKYTSPLIKERLENIRRKDAGENKTWEEPNDYLTWHIRTATAEGRADCLTVNRIAQCLMPLNFASIHTTSLTGHSALLDILSTDPKLGVLETLREEAERIWREDNGRWTKTGVARMYKIDSALRESMRRSTFATTMSVRKVIAPEGITNPTEGWHAPYGSHISCPLIGVQLDPDFYDGPEVYDPFRYSREREAYEARAEEEKNAREGLRLKATGMVTTSDKFFPFGHGRHACPGRFFVAHELKMIIAHLVMNYDIKYLEQRPQAKYIGRNIIPPGDACIEVRRRAK